MRESVPILAANTSMGFLSIFERFDKPAFLWLTVVVVLLYVMARRSLAAMGPIRGRLSLAVRALVVLMLIFVLAGAHRILKNDDLNVLFVLDQSLSIPAAIRSASQDFAKAATRFMKPNDRAAVLTFDGSTNIEQLPTRPGPDGGIHVATPFAGGQQPDRTNLARALRVAAACALDTMNNRVVLFTDGNQNVGDGLDEARSAKSSKITIDVVPLRAEIDSDVLFEELRTPAYASLHERIQLRMILSSHRDTTGTILVYQRVGQEESPVDLDPASAGFGVRRALRAGRNSFVLRLPIEAQRAHEFRAEFIPDDKSADAILQNNAARAFTNVEGPRTVLLLGSAREREENQLLVDALMREKIDVHTFTAESVNLETSLLQDYAAIILANVPADAFSQAQQQALATYVRDLGGGLVMIGGEDAFAAGGWQGSIIEDIMPVRFEVDAVKQIPRGALAIVMHSCEMPQGNQWGVQTAIAALKALSSLDYYGIVGWGPTGFHWEVPMAPATNKNALIARIQNMTNADMFDFESPMRMAYQALMNCKDVAQRHMIIISDGDPQAPSSGLLNQMVGSRVTCSTVSIFPHGGMEISTLKNIAKITKGNYYALSRPGDEQMLPRIFIKEARVVRRPVIRDEVFIPVVKPNLSDIMVGLATPLPELGGYVVTTPRVAPDVEMPLVTQRGDPLLAHWLCDLGRTVAFTSGRWQHWGAHWTSWPGFSKLWAQAVRWCMSQGSAADYDVRTIVEGDQGRVIIESMDEKGFADFQQFQGRVINPDGTSTRMDVVQVGPGRYEGRFKVGAQGTYLQQITAPGSKSDKPVVIRTGVNVSYSPEYKNLGVNESLLEQIRQSADGRTMELAGDPAEVFKHNLPPTISRTPIWDWLLKLAIVTFLVDVAVRRIAIDPLKAAIAARNYLATLAIRWRTGERAEVVLADLKDVRKQVRKQRTAEGDTASLKKASPPIQDVIPSEAPKSTPPPPSEQPSSQPGQKPPESTMSRLLKAKKRAKDPPPEPPDSV